GEDCRSPHYVRWHILRIVGSSSNDLKDTCPRRPMYWRPISEADLSKCLEIPPECLGDQIVGRSTALRVWKAFLHDPSFHANVIESEIPIEGHKIVACGMGVFVTRAFADREIQHPQPGLNSRIIAGVASGESVVLSRTQIAAGNAGDGLDFVNMYGTWRE